MSSRKQSFGRQSVQVEVEVPGTSENAGQNIAAGDNTPGTRARFAPSRIPRRVGMPALPLRTLLASFVILIMLSSAFAQEAPTLRKELDYLKQLVGTWEADVENGKGTMTYRMDLGGLWLMGDFDGEFAGMKFQGRSMETYDPAMKKYRSVWADSFTTSPRVMEGGLDHGEKVLTMTGEGCGADGMPTTFRSITEIKDAKTVDFVLFMSDKDGHEQQMTKITYKRTK